MHPSPTNALAKYSQQPASVRGIVIIDRTRVFTETSFPFRIPRRYSQLGFGSGNVAPVSGFPVSAGNFIFSRSLSNRGVPRSGLRLCPILNHTIAQLRSSYDLSYRSIALSKSPRPRYTV